MRAFFLSLSGRLFVQRNRYRQEYKIWQPCRHKWRHHVVHAERRTHRRKQDIERRQHDADTEVLPHTAADLSATHGDAEQGHDEGP